MQTAGGLCVPLTPRSLDEVFSADLSGADCVEVRLDYLKNPLDSVHVRWDKLPVPVIATCRRQRMRRTLHRNDEEEIRILQYAVENGAKFVDIDYRFAEPIPGAQVIASFHDFDCTPPDIAPLMEAVCASPGQIAKMATMVNSWNDNRRLLDLLSLRWPKPVIVVGMGEIGQMTRVIGPSRGSFLTYAGLDANASAPGQLTMREMRNVYRFRRIGPDTTKLIGIVGNPVGHSLSPQIHNRAFEATGSGFCVFEIAVAGS